MLLLRTTTTIPLKLALLSSLPTLRTMQILSISLRSNTRGLLSQFYRQNCTPLLTALIILPSFDLQLRSSARRNSLWLYTGTQIPRVSMRILSSLEQRQRSDWWSTSCVYGRVMNVDWSQRLSAKAKPYAALRHLINNNKINLESKQ